MQKRMELLAERNMWQVNHAIAQNPKTPLKILERIAETGAEASDILRVKLTATPASSPEILHRVLEAIRGTTYYTPRILRQVNDHPAANLETFLHLLEIYDRLEDTASSPHTIMS